MPGAVFLGGENIELRTIEEEDIEFLRDHVNDPEIRSSLTIWRPMNIEQEREFFEEVVSAEEPVNLMVTRDGEPLGTVELREKEQDRIGELGIWLKKEAQDNGYGTEAAERLAEYAFNELNFHKVTARAFGKNKASRKVWEKLGFEEEGKMREEVYRNGEYEDVFYYGLLKEEF
ncbi:MAG: GNAT family N-acetyltransferase [Candidatus Aenigmatarchaeota archaeon]